MLTSREIWLAREVVEELRARGAEEKAAAIERIVATAAPNLSAEPKLEPPGLLTISQAAHALGVSVQAIKNWANAGQVETVRLGGRVMIRRDSLLNYLDRIRQSRLGGIETPPESQESDARREFVLAGLPRGKVERVGALTEKIEASQQLTPAEERELTRLQEEFARVSWERVKQWVARHQSSA